MNDAVKIVPCELVSNAVKIVSLELENVKRVQVVHLQPAANGLTVIGGDNAQGKTSILDGIMFLLGGEKYRPSNLQREGALASARGELRLSNGLLVERTGKNATLKVTDPAGIKGGQKLLDSFVDELALNLPKFLAMKGTEKAGVLLRILGIGPQLDALEREERAVYQDREAQGRIADQKDKYFKECPWSADVPDAPLSAGELVQAAQAVMARNAERANAHRRIETLKQQAEAAGMAEAQADAAVQRLNAEYLRAVEEQTRLRDARIAAILAVEADILEPITEDESTAVIEQQIADMEEINAKVRANLDKQKAKEDAEAHAARYVELTAKVEEVRTRRRALLDGAAMPLPGLSVDGGELTYNGKAWDCMSGVEQIRAGVAIVRKLQPACGFVLLDKLEAFDVGQLNELGAWLQAEGLQAIATRVSRGGECSIIIEDGLVVGAAVAAETETEKEW